MARNRLRRYQRQDVSRTDFKPNTPYGKTALEHRNEGPFRPGKTDQDYTPPQQRQRFKDWQRRQMTAAQAQREAA